MQPFSSVSLVTAQLSLITETALPRLAIWDRQPTLRQPGSTLSTSTWDRLTVRPQGIRS